MRPRLAVSCLALGLAASAIPSNAAPNVSSVLGSASVETGKAATVANYIALSNYIEAVQMNRYAAAVRQNQAQASSINSRHLTPQRSTAGGGVGACTGFAIPDYIIRRESGGDPNAVNPSSGAIGCSQTLPSHYAAGNTCGGLDMHTVDGQRECTQRLVDRSGLAPWGG